MNKAPTPAAPERPRRRPGRAPRGRPAPAGRPVPVGGAQPKKWISPVCAAYLPALWLRGIVAHFVGVVAQPKRWISPVYSTNMPSLWLRQLYHTSTRYEHEYSVRSTGRCPIWREKEPCATLPLRHGLCRRGKRAGTSPVYARRLWIGRPIFSRATENGLAFCEFLVCANKYAAK